MAFRTKYYPPVYGLWTNKGGVGKTTLAFHLSTTYAALYPEKAVIVIDMCPQCNLSASLTTYSTAGDHRVDGSERAAKLMDDPETYLVTQSGRIPRTVGGYLSSVTGSVSAPLPDDMLKDLLTEFNENNSYLPNNLRLLSGDRCLDGMSGKLSLRASEPQTVTSHPFVDIHEILKNFITLLSEDIRKKTPGKEVVVFIDTNPAMTPYTCIALCAITDLIIPVNADSYSAEAVKSMFHQVYGIYPPGGLAAAFEENTFAYKAKQPKTRLQLPRINCIVHNRAPVFAITVAHGGVAPAAFGVISNEQAQLLFNGYNKAKAKGTEELNRVFKPLSNGLVHSSLHTFKKDYTATMKDMTSCGIASTHSGIPLWLLQEKRKLLMAVYRRAKMLDTLPHLVQDLKYLMEKVFGPLDGADPTMLSKINSFCAQAARANNAGATPQAPAPAPAQDNDDIEEQEDRPGDQPAAQQAATAPGVATAANVLTGAFRQTGAGAGGNRKRKVAQGG